MELVEVSSYVDLINSFRVGLYFISKLTIAFNINTYKIDKSTLILCFADLVPTTYKHTHILTHTHLHTDTHTHCTAHTITNLYTHTQTHINSHTNIYILTHKYFHTYTNKHILTHTYFHTHTHTHMSVCLSKYLTKCVFYDFECLCLIFISKTFKISKPISFLG